MSDPRVLILGGRRRGRPPSTEPKTHLTVYMPTVYVDRLAQLALRHDVSVSQALCRVLDTAAALAPRPGISVQNK